MSIFRRLLDWLLRLLGIRRKNDFRGELFFRSKYPHHWRNFDMNLDVQLGDTGTHTAVYAVTNLDGTPAEGVTVSYASDNPAVCGVNADNGLLSINSVGTANITGTGTRGAFSHSDSGTVTIAQSDDFTGVLMLT